MIEKKVRVSKIGSEQSDYAFWQTKSFAERLQALEEIREEYNAWRYSDAERRFQRVYRVFKQT